MPVRLLREGILSSERVDQLDAPAEVFYRRLMSKVDDHGLFDARVAMLRSSLYPLRVDRVREADISRWIAACEKAGLIALYSHDGKPFLQMLRTQWQARSAPKYPPPPWAGVEGRAQGPPGDGLGGGPGVAVNACSQLQTVVGLDVVGDEGIGIPTSSSSSKTNTHTHRARHGTPQVVDNSGKSVRAAAGEWPGLALAQQACEAMQKTGLQGVSLHHPKLAALLALGATAGQLAEAAAEAVAGGKAFAYALGIAANRLRDARDWASGFEPASAGAGVGGAATGGGRAGRGGVAGAARGPEGASTGQQVGLPGVAAVPMPPEVRVQMGRLLEQWRKRR